MFFPFTIFSRSFPPPYLLNFMFSLSFKQIRKQTIVATISYKKQKTRNKNTKMKFKAKNKRKIR